MRALNLMDFATFFRCMDFKNIPRRVKVPSMCLNEIMSDVSKSNYEKRRNLVLKVMAYLKRVRTELLSGQLIVAEVQNCHFLEILKATVLYELDRTSG